MNNKLFTIIFLSIVISCKAQPNVKLIENNAPKFAKNIILLIGDGTGIGQISAATYVNKNHTELERFPIVGLHKPYASDSLITDSAAAATAFACGIKTFYHAIGVGPDSLPVQTILEEANLKGLKTGLVASSSIVHATPASFIAHCNSRIKYEEIAEYFLMTDIDYFVGGGKKFFDRRMNDDRNLIKELESKGYVIKDYLQDFNTCKKEIFASDKFGYFSADDQPLSFEQGREYLREASNIGVEYLSKNNKEGFFIMIEGSQIDWGGHANNANYIITEFLEFNDIIGDILDWAEKDGETLVVFTSDHETGGFTIQPGSTWDGLVTAFTTPGHSGDMVPVFAYGPQSGSFSGIYENYQIYHKMRKALGWD